MLLCNGMKILQLSNWNLYRMKRGALRRRAKDISLVFIVLVCATLVLWSWDTTPSSAFLPPDSHFLKLEPEEKVERTPTTLNAETKDSYSSATPFVNKGNYLKEVCAVCCVLKFWKLSFIHFPGLSITEQSKEDPTDNKDTEEEDEEKEEKQVAKVTDSETNQGKTSTIEEEHVQREVTVSEPKYQKTPTSKESKLEQVKQEVAAGEAAAKTTHIKKTNSDPEKKTLATDEERTEENLVKKDDDSSSTARISNQACNYAKGKWVVDNHRPLYSGSRCKQWLASMWACRLMQRTDFAFERLRWQPKDCSMEEFEGSRFLKRMQDKTLAFVGDSLGRQQFQSMMCMITGGKERLDVLDVGPEFGFITPQGGGRPNGWAYRFPETNTTVLYHWSSTLCDIEPLNISDPLTEHAMHLDRPPAFLRQYLHKINVLVMNTGHHWNRGKLNGNRWVMHLNGVPNANKKLAALGNAKNFTIHSTVSWVSSQLPHHPGLKAFYRSLSPRHFVGGEWNTGGSCNNTTPMSIGKEVLQEESSDYSAGHAVKGTGVKLL
ncbi:hypothetical protein IGI04_041108 [Brassica rapa subsp. trilocularis]|uniref:Trichome birefringence-like N-terminal domain-containing protein n=1 Tax=Brassica rapa subsp. trilocularis TaxID=1813537 RepID=A0ABQ7KRB7_BRACM|nr:hypothetical protein IGI04_041108 [Brassica rapa subsp. trilocularis]